MQVRIQIEWQKSAVQKIANFNLSNIRIARQHVHVTQSFEYSGDFVPFISSLCNQNLFEPYSQRVFTDAICLFSVQLWIACTRIEFKSQYSVVWGRELLSVWISLTIEMFDADIICCIEINRYKGTLSEMANYIKFKLVSNICEKERQKDSFCRERTSKL